MSRKSVYLTGWEYNRLMQEDPTRPRQSGLPAESLWNGGALFWMFETVWCTKESFETEQQVDDLSQEATREVWAELKRRGILQLYDLASAGISLRQELLEKHSDLRSKYDGEALRTLILTGNDAELETIKSYLLQPVMSELGCAQNVSPNSIKNWFRARPNPSASALAVEQALRALVTHADDKLADVQLGTSLCGPPGTGLEPGADLAQKRFEGEQRPIIPDLFLGHIDMKDYVTRQVPHADAFRPISSQLRADWSQNKDKLFTLRDRAERFIWDDLHNDWLPQLEADPKFRPRFNRLVTDAINRARMGELLDWATRLVVLGFAATITAVAGPVVGVAAGVAAEKLVDDKLKASERLALFYQDVLRVSRGS